MRPSDDNEYYLREYSFSDIELTNYNPFSTRFRGAAFVSPRTDSLYKLHRHNGYEIIVPLAESYRCILNGEHVSVGKNSFLMIQPGDSHQDELRKGSDFFAIGMDLLCRDPLFEDSCIFRREVPVSGRIASIEGQDGLRELLELFSRTARKDSPRIFYVLRGLCEALFWEFMMCFPSSSFSRFFVQNSEQEDFRGMLLKFFEENTNCKFSLDDMADSLGMSRRSLIRKSQESLKQPPLKAFNEYRMRRAEELVRNTDMPFKDISRMLGFENQYHFSRLFKEYFKQSPRMQRTGIDSPRRSG